MFGFESQLPELGVFLPAAARLFGPDEYLSCTEHLEVFQNLAVHAFHRGNDGRNRRDADDDTERGQNAAGLVDPNLAQGQRCTLQSQPEKKERQPQN